jgi:hypothetical protein
MQLISNNLSAACTCNVLIPMGEYARRVGALCIIAFLVNCKPSEPYLTR